MLMPIATTNTRQPGTPSLAAKAKETPTPVTPPEDTLITQATPSRRGRRRDVAAAWPGESSLGFPPVQSRGWTRAWQRLQGGDVAHRRCRCPQPQQRTDFSSALSVTSSEHSKLGREDKVVTFGHHHGEGKPYAAAPPPTPPEQARPPPPCRPATTARRPELAPLRRLVARFSGAAAPASTVRIHRPEPLLHHGAGQPRARQSPNQTPPPRMGAPAPALHATSTRRATTTLQGRRTNPRRHQPPPPTGSGQETPDPPPPRPSPCPGGQRRAAGQREQGRAGWATMTPEGES